MTLFPYTTLFRSVVDSFNMSAHLIKFNAFSTSNKKLWIIDSGATDHMTGCLELLQNLTTKNIKKASVTVANGIQVPIEGIGETNFFEKTITNVLYMPSFTSNLLSVSKITQELNCKVIFTQKDVIFHDIVTGKKIGEGYFENGLYILASFNQAHIARNSCISRDKLLHYRLGHPSDSVLEKLFVLPNLNSSCCDVCRYAKQTRLPFSNSKNKSTIDRKSTRLNSSHAQ